MTLFQQILTVAAVILGTMTTRFLPFIIFPPGKPTPKYIHYLGKMLPAAAIGLLVVYSFKDVSFTAGNHGIPELIAAAVTAVLHCTLHRMIVSIAGGTVCYMLLVQTLFAG